ncbi:MAG: fibronectin type III domain-containing protein [Actinomycetales bacterium]|nr:fibronectin type III domain-containing protein [Actinomycetales bacterium]
MKSSLPRFVLAAAILVMGLPVTASPALAAPGDFTNFTTTDGLGANYVNGVYVLDDTIYAATYGGGLSISIDGDDTFTNRTNANSSLGDNSVWAVYVTDDTVYAATDFGGLSISANGGATFTNRTNANSSLGNDVVNGVYADDTVYAATDGGLSISANGGSSFINKTTFNGLGHNQVWDVYAAGSTVYAATNGGLSISTNGGTSFTNKTSGNGLGSSSVNGVFAIGSKVYAATAGGLSLSTNGGSSFTNKTTADGLGDNYVSGVYAIGSMVYAATAGGLSVSTNGGASFTNYTTADGLGSNAVNWVYAIGSTVYAATSGGLSIGSPTLPPGPLAGVAAASGNGTASVSWTVDDTGGSAVTRIEFALDDTVTVDDSTTNVAGPYTLSGLVNGQAYTVYARAVNAIGAGPWSTGTPVTPQAPAPPTPAPVFPPGAPGSVTAVPGNGSATVTWAAPASTGSYPVSTYQVSASPGGSSCMTSALTCEVSGLANGKTYTFTVRALSGAGWGTPSAASNAVTPTAPAARTILITGSRDPGDRRIVVVTGRTTGLAGEQLTPWARIPGRTDYTAGQTTVTVASDGTFTWTRKANKRTQVYFTHDTTTSNTITIATRSRAGTHRLS